MASTFPSFILLHSLGVVLTYSEPDVSLGTNPITL